MNEKHITAWITKYALTDGISVVNAEVSSTTNTMISWKDGNYLQHAHGKDWHRTPEAALDRAEEMRKAKIASLRKSITKMESLKFTVPAK